MCAVPINPALIYLHDLHGASTQQVLAAQFSRKLPCLQELPKVSQMLRGEMAEVTSKFTHFIFVRKNPAE